MSWTAPQVLQVTTAYETPPCSVRRTVWASSVCGCDNALTPRQADHARTRANGRHPIAFFDDDDVARHQLGRVDLAGGPVTHGLRPLGDVLRQCLHRLLGLDFLNEGESGIQHDGGCDDQLTDDQ
ncbi:hypothetical protein ABN273_49020 [Nonomuraea sp. B19D2]